MRVLLVHPPQATWFAPYLALPSLAAPLRAAGHDVRLFDLNLRTNRTFLSADYLRALAGSEGEALGHAAAAAVAHLRDPRTYASVSALRAAFGPLDAAYAAVSRAFAPTEVSYGLTMRHDPLTRAGLAAATRDAAENPYLGLFAETVLPELVRDPPDVLGLGLAFETQLVPALTLARLVKAALPETHVVVGGNVVTKMAPRLLALDYLFEGVDTAVVNEGETALLGLLEALGRDPARLDGVPNLLWRRDGRLVRNPAQHEEDLATLPTPDFDGLPLDEYLLPLRLLPLLTSRGCYWGRCAFCTHRHGYGRFRFRPEALLAADLDTLRARHGSDAFFLADEAVPPRQVSALARYATTRQAPLRWFGDVRFERFFAAPHGVAALAESGCRMLAFGLESGCQRVLDRMDKGGSPALAEAVLRATAGAGIFDIVMFFSGFPGETLQEAHATVQLVQRLGGLLGGHGNGAFSLQEGAPAQRDPARYGIVELTPDARELAATYDYRVQSGLDAASAGRIAAAIRRQREGDPRFGEALPREVTFARLVLARDDGGAR